MTFEQEVWDTLSSINVNEHTEKKGKLTYLSWAWAWAELMKHYPQSSYKFKPSFIYANGTAEVWVTLTVKRGDDKLKRQMWLPVMDYKNDAVVNPDSRAISDTRMRCLTKVMAMVGLGHYIYAGEDLPSSYTTSQFQDYHKLLHGGDAQAFYVFLNTLSDAARTDLHNSFEKGKVTEYKKKAQQMESDGIDAFNKTLEQIKSHIENRDEDGMHEIFDECNELEKITLVNSFHGEDRDAIYELMGVKK